MLCRILAFLNHLGDDEQQVRTPNVMPYFLNHLGDDEQGEQGKGA
nr:hypothetical protein [Acinetobacter radioresistens]